MKEQWIDKPTRGGDYWQSSFCNGKYIRPKIINVIDFDRPERGLEIGGSHCDNTPVEEYVKEYYPKARYLYIPVPKLPTNST